MSIEHIYCFSYYDLREPSVRYRGKYVLEELKKNYGITYSIVYPGYTPGAILRFLLAFSSALFWRRKNSIILFQNIYSHRIYARLLKLLLFFRRKQTLYDIDDADYVRFPPQTIHYFMRNCEACSVGSRALRDYALPFNPNVFLLTSPVIQHGYKKDKLNTIFTIGWIGFYNAHKYSLQQLFFPALEQLQFKVKLVLMGVSKSEDRIALQNHFSKYKHVVLEIPDGIDWLDESSVYRQIKEFDIGVSPLLDTELNRAKSAFKLKQCLSCGIPVLGSALGENAVFLKEGINGYFCETPADYKRTIEKLYSESEEEYLGLSYNAFRATRNFSIKNYCKILMEFYGTTESSTTQPVTKHLHQPA